MGAKAKAKAENVRVHVPKPVIQAEGQRLPRNGPAPHSDELLFDRLKRKHSDIPPKELNEHLAKPLELQPLWLATGRGIAMNREERADVILAHFKRCGMTFKQSTSTKPLQKIFLRAIKRQVQLTYKQWEVASLTVKGSDNGQIAGELKISERMVKTHLQAVRRKARVDRNAKIVLWFLGY
jgi:DNA-binding CsgD family transcriptional regulator